MHIRGGMSDIYELAYFQSEILGPNKIMSILFLTKNIVEMKFLCLLEAILTSVCIVSGYFMFMDRFLSIK